MFENRDVHIDLLIRHLQIDYLNVMEISDFINKFLVTSQLVTRKYVREPLPDRMYFHRWTTLLIRGCSNTPQLLKHERNLMTWPLFELHPALFLSHTSGHSLIF